MMGDDGDEEVREGEDGGEAVSGEEGEGGGQVRVRESRNDKG